MKRKKQYGILLIAFFLVNLVPLSGNKIFYLFQNYVLPVTMLILTLVFLAECLVVKKHTCCVRKDTFFIIKAVLAALLYFLLTFVFERKAAGWFSFFYGLSIYFLIKNLHFTERTKRIILFIFVCVWMLWLSQAKGYYSYFMVEFYDRNNIYILNPNQVGLLIMMITIVILSFLLHYRFSCFIMAVFYLLGLWGCWNCSRGSTTGLLIYGFLQFCFSKRFWTYKKMKILLTLVFIAGIIFPVLYCYMSTVDSLGNLQIHGKGIFSGREDLWSEGFQIYLSKISNILFGAGSAAGYKLTYINRDGNNLHNSFIKILYSFGLAGFLGYYFIIMRHTFYMYKEKMNPAKRSFFFGFISICISSYFEILIGASLSSFLIYSMLAFSSHMDMQEKGELRLSGENKRKRYSAVRGTDAHF